MKFTRGFTLAEILVTVVSASVLLGALLAIFNVVDMSYRRESVMSGLAQQVNNGMQRMAGVLRASRASMVIGMADGNDRIVFSTPTASGMGFNLTDGILMSEDSAGQQTPVASHITRLKFSKIGYKLKIDLMAEEVYGSQKFDYSLSQVVRLRNE